jgi:hypothetical protein
MQGEFCMAKKETGTATVDVSLMGLSEAQIAIYNGLSAEDQADILEISDLAEKIAMIESLGTLISSTAQLASVDLKEVKKEAERFAIFTAGGPGMRAGTSFRAAFMGTNHIFLNEYRENWEEYVENDTTWFYNSNFKFKGVADGKEFGVWSYGTLSDLRKIPTLSSGSGLVDPIVEVTYVGKVEGRDVLKAKYGIELNRGNEAHVFIVKTDVDFNRYESGIVNSLNAPYPLASKKSSVNKYEATRLNYEKIQAAQGKTSGLLAQ